MAEIKGYKMPDDLYYHKDFCWVRFEGDELARVGLIDFAQSEAGDITYVDLPFEGDTIQANETCGKVQSAKWIGKLTAPLSGEIVNINYDLEGDATLINSDCYGRGWIFTLRPSNAEAEKAHLMNGQPALDWLERAIAEVEKGKAEGKRYAQE
jgi:glycine cleavage system H protein